MTQGLITGRDFGLVGKSGVGGAGGATAGAVAMGGSKTAWLAKVTFPFLYLNGQMSERRHGFIYDDRTLSMNVMF
jgi:hypothetical protein